MNRNDKNAYFQQMEASALRDMERIALRLEWLQGVKTPLWPEELEILVHHHQKAYKDSNERLGRAQSWMSTNVQVPFTLLDRQVERLSDILLGERLPLDICERGLPIIPTNKVVTKPKIVDLVQAWHNGTLEIDPSPIRNRVWQVLERCQNQYETLLSTQVPQL